MSSESEQKFYKGMPVKDADKALQVTLSIANVKESTPRDPENCAFAVCLKRTLGVSTVAINKTSAYIESKSEQGSIVEKYVPSKKVGHFIDLFDGEEISSVPKQSFWFYPPSKSRKISYKGKKTIEVQTPKEQIENPIQSKVVVSEPKKRKTYHALRGKIRFD